VCRSLLADAKAILTFCDHWLIDQSGRRLIQDTDSNTNIFGRGSLPAGPVSDPLRLIVANAIPLAMGSVFRKSAVDWRLYSEKVEGAYDYFLSYCLLRSGGKIVYVAERLTEYRIHRRSASAEFNMANSTGGAYVYDLILGDPRFLSIAKDVRMKAIGFEEHLVKLFLRRFNLVSAAVHCRKALGYRLSNCRRHRGASKPGYPG
jgi:hypothetical protein